MNLLQKAAEVMKHAYAPYSKFTVGAAVKAASGKVYVGCNVENASYGATICAERTAITQAIACGEKSILEIAIINGTNRPCTPCGICLQVIAEFGKDVEITCADVGQKHLQKFYLKELLPQAYDNSFLDVK